MGLLRTLFFTFLLLALTSCSADTRTGTAASVQLYVDRICANIPPQFSFVHAIVSKERCITFEENYRADIDACISERLTNFSNAIDNAYSIANKTSRPSAIRNIQRHPLNYNSLCLAVVQELQLPNSYTNTRSYASRKISSNIKDSMMQAYKTILEKHMPIATMSLAEQCQNSLRLYLAEKVKTFGMEAVPESLQKRINMSRTNYNRCKNDAYSQNNIDNNVTNRPILKQQSQHSNNHAEPSGAQNSTSVRDEEKANQTTPSPTMDSDPIDGEKRISVIPIRIVD